MKLGSIKDMRLQENVRLDHLLLALSEHALANGDLMAIDRHLKISKARRELWRLHREAGEPEPDQNTFLVTPEQLMEQMKQVRRQGIVLPDGTHIPYREE